MPTRKELLEDLVSETSELRASVSDNTDASEALVSEIDRLQEDITEASYQLSTISDRTLAEFSDRIADLRGALSEGAEEIGNAIVRGHLVGNLVGQVIANTLHNQATDPRMIMARRINQAINIIAEAYNTGSRNDYDATLRLLRVHEFRAEQARYIVDLLLEKYEILAVFEEDDGTEYIMIDSENPACIEVLSHYKRGTYVYLV